MTLYAEFEEQLRRQGVAVDSDLDNLIRRIISRSYEKGYTDK